MAHNGDKKREIEIGKNKIVGIGNYHKTLPHNEYGEVIPKSFKEFVDETEKLEPDFGNVDEGKNPKCAKKPYDPKDLKVAALTNPQAGLSEDKLTAKPSTYRMPPAPPVLSNTTAAEMTELYWMAALRDLSFDKFESDPKVKVAVKEINETFSEVTGEQGDGSLLKKELIFRAVQMNLSNSHQKQSFVSVYPVKKLVRL